MEIDVYRDEIENEFRLSSTIPDIQWTRAGVDKVEMLLEITFGTECGVTFPSAMVGYIWCGVMETQWGGKFASQSPERWTGF